MVPDLPGGLISSSFPVAFQHLSALLCWGLLLSAWCDPRSPHPPQPLCPADPAVLRAGDGQGQEGGTGRRIPGGAGRVSEEAQGGGPLRCRLWGRGPRNAFRPGPEPRSEVCRSGAGTGFSRGEREFQHQSLTGMDVDFLVSFTGLFLRSNRKEMC